MRKFTKEIAALLATAAVSSSMSVANAETEENVIRTAGVAIRDDLDIEPATTTVPCSYSDDMCTEVITTPTIGTQVATYPTTTITSTTMPPFAGGAWSIPSETTVPEDYPPLAGVMMELPRTTTAPETTIPSIAGTMVATTTTTPAEEEEIPPLVGDVALPDGDINGDGSFGVSDVVTLQKYLLNAPDIKIINWYAADMCPDGELNIFDLIFMKRELVTLKIYEVGPVIKDENK